MSPWANPCTITELAGGLPANTNPGGVRAGPDGNLWFIDNRTPQSVASFGIGAPAPSVEAPEIRGKAERGGKVHCEKGDWSRWAGDKPSRDRWGFDGLQWSIDGVAIPGQTSKEYRPTAADVGTPAHLHGDGDVHAVPGTRVGDERADRRARGLTRRERRPVRGGPPHVRAARYSPAMAKESDKDLLARLADAGEDALRRLGEAPGMDRAMAYAKTTRKQLDELTKRVQGISELEARIAKLEKQVASLSKDTSSSKRTPARKAPPTPGP